MLPFETPSVFDQLPRYLLKIPRVVKDQKHKFETEDLFKKLSREGEVSRRFPRLYDRLAFSAREAPRESVFFLRPAPLWPDLSLNFFQLSENLEQRR